MNPKLIVAKTYLKSLYDRYFSGEQNEEKIVRSKSKNELRKEANQLIKECNQRIVDFEKEWKVRICLIHRNHKDFDLDKMENSLKRIGIWWG